MAPLKTPGTYTSRVRTSGDVFLTYHTTANAPMVRLAIKGHRRCRTQDSTGIIQRTIIDLIYPLGKHLQIPQITPLYQTHHIPHFEPRMNLIGNENFLTLRRPFILGGKYTR